MVLSLLYMVFFLNVECFHSLFPIPSCGSLGKPVRSLLLEWEATYESEKMKPFQNLHHKRTTYATQSAFNIPISYGFFMRPENIKGIFSVHIWLSDIGMTQPSLQSFVLEAFVPYLQARLENSSSRIASSVRFF